MRLDPEAIREFNRNQQRTRLAYAAQPLESTGGPRHCLGACGKRSPKAAPYCSVCDLKWNRP